MEENRPRRRLHPLFIALLVLILISIPMMGYSGYKLWEWQNTPLPVLCRTYGCRQTRNEILRYYDPSVDPCEDFFRFACGKAKEGDHLIVRTMERRRQFNHDILVNPQMDKISANSTIAAIQFYRNCMESEPKNETAFETLFPDYETMEEELFGRKIDWIDLTIRARNKGMRFNFFMDLSVNMRMSDFIWLLQVSPLSQDYAYVWDSKNAPYIKILTNFWRKNLTSVTDGEIHDLIYYGNKISHINTTNFKEQIVEIADLALRTGFDPNWLQLFENITQIDTLTNKDFVYLNDDLPQRSYFKMLQSYTSMQKNFWFNYIALITMLDECFFLSEPAQTACASILGQNKTSFCENIVQSSLPGVLEAAYIRTIANDDIVYKARDLFGDVRAALINQMMTMTFPQRFDFDNILEHLRPLMLNFGGLYWIENYEIFERNYGTDLTVLNSTDASETYYKILKHTADRKYKSVSMTVHDMTTDLLRFGFSDDWIYGSYSQDMNTVYFPPESLLLPEFSLDRPKYLNIVRLGNWFAREMIKSILKPHSFGIPQWNSSADLRIQRRISCVNDQYKKYLQSMSMPQPESDETNYVADVAGIIATYHLFKRAAKEQLWYKPLFDEKELTKNQLFWLFRGNKYCTTMKEAREGSIKAFGQSIKLEGFPPYRVVNGPLNYPDFARDFHCKPNQKMVRQLCPILVENLTAFGYE